MDLSTVIAIVLVLAAVPAVLWQRRRVRRIRAELREWVALAKFNGRSYYDLACQVYGKAAVDRAIRQDQERARRN